MKGFVVHPFRKQRRRPPIVDRAPFTFLRIQERAAEPSWLSSRVLAHLRRPRQNDAKAMDLFISAGYELQILRVRGIFESLTCERLMN